MLDELSSMTQMFYDIADGIRIFPLPPMTCIYFKTVFSVQEFILRKLQIITLS